MAGEKERGRRATGREDGGGGGVGDVGGRDAARTARWGGAGTAGGGAASPNAEDEDKGPLPLRRLTVIPFDGVERGSTIIVCVCVCVCV